MGGNQNQSLYPKLYSKPPAVFLVPVAVATVADVSPGHDAPVLCSITYGKLAASAVESGVESIETQKGPYGTLNPKP